MASKLGYEWKFVIRDLKQKDHRNIGKCTTKEFLETLEAHGVNLLKEEWRACRAEYETLSGHTDKAFMSVPMIDYMVRRKSLYVAVVEGTQFA